MSVPPSGLAAAWGANSSPNPPREALSAAGLRPGAVVGVKTALASAWFAVSTDVGAEARPLQKGASGGELSRVMLALEVTLAGTGTVPTFVFDEVDAGVGGAAAVEVGRRLARLARDAQVLVVTHLPQVAAYADRHVVVTKADDGTVTSSGLTVLDYAERERELSRMMGGDPDSEAGLAHARELLEQADALRGSRVGAA